MNTCSWIMDDESECGERCEGNTPFCGSHNRTLRRENSNAKKEAEKRKAMLTKPKLKLKADITQPVYKLAKIKKVSDKLGKKLKIYSKLAEQFKKDNPLCHAKVNEYCTKTTQDIHHKQGRYTSLLDVSTFLPVCRSCHSYIEAHPKEAIEKGWSMSRLATVEPHKI